MGNNKGERARDAASLPDDWWQHEVQCRQFSHTFGARVLALQLSVEANGILSDTIFTGWVMSHDRVLLWVTAGHVIDKIAHIRKAGGKVLRSSWLDSYPDRAAGFVPFDLDQLMVHSATEKGLDIGAAGITGLTAENLLANKQLKPVTAQMWMGIESAKPEGYYLIGVPEELVSVRRRKVSGSRGECELSADVVVLPVRHRPDFRATDGMEPPDDPCLWWGELLPWTGSASGQPKSVRGMSGGLLLSIQRTPDGQGFRSYLFGVQSTWYPEKRIIGAVPIQRLLEHFQTLVRKDSRT
jgi:hypothetical protein